MGSTESELGSTKPTQQFRDWLAEHFGMSPERKQSIYLDISRAATLLDLGYWLQILFAAGIATLGLVLNSPAVIIGAMLISPLMGPILSGGLGLAAGDIVLTIRAALNLFLSCLVSVGIAALLVWLLPFKEITAEIAARTQPNTLDLVVALFCGAIGSISICQPQKGVVTSIPGVAIAVALMPPLSVVGFGIGVATAVNPVEGFRIAGGGGLLFLTNLAAITFTAMLVFLLLHINTKEVRSQVRQWAEQDVESTWLRRIVLGTPVIRRLRGFQSLAARMAFVLSVIAILAIPLSRSFTRLKGEIARKRQENEVLQLASRLCEQRVGDGRSGARCYVSGLSMANQGDRLAVSLRTFTRKPYSPVERETLLHDVSRLLQRPAESLLLQLVEIPTTSGNLPAQAQEQPRIQPILTVSALERELLGRTGASLETLELPAPAQFVGYELTATSNGPLRIKIAYLSDHAMGNDAQDLLARSIATRFQYPDLPVEFTEIPNTFRPIPVRIKRFKPGRAENALLDAAGQALQRHPSLEVTIETRLSKQGSSKDTETLNATISDYLQTNWQIASDRIRTGSAQDKGKRREVILRIMKRQPFTR